MREDVSKPGRRSGARSRAFDSGPSSQSDLFLLIFGDHGTASWAESYTLQRRERGSAAFAGRACLAAIRAEAPVWVPWPLTPAAGASIGGRRRPLGERPP